MLAMADICRALQDCCRRKDPRAGRRIYCLITQNSCESVAPLADHIIRALSSSGNLQDSCKVFCYVPKPSIYTWTALISAHVDLNDPVIALHLHQGMQTSDLPPDRVMFLCVLKACSSMGALQYGRLIHHQVMEYGFDTDVVVGNTLVDMYAKCKDFVEATAWFHSLPHHSVVSWSALIAGFARHGYGEDALDCFTAMQDEGFRCSKDMFLCILKVCSSGEAIGEGMEIHDQVIRQGLERDVLIGSTLIDMYSKCHCLEAARKVFEMMPSRTEVSWGALITGYARHGYGFIALGLFERMQKDKIRPGEFLLTSMLKVCAIIGAAKQGQLFYEQVLRSECKVDIAVVNALIDMHCKCGNTEVAQRVLNGMPTKDVASWGAMIAGYASQGRCKDASECLKSMVKEGFKPDAGIFMNILAAYSHAGMLEEARHQFKAMINDYMLIPTIEHYNCMIDLLGRAGCLNEASDLLRTLSATPDVIGWRSLLTGCRTFKNINMANNCFDEAFGS